jgi:hypothetical protein
VLEDFRSVVERALGVEVQDDFTNELRGDRCQDQKGHTGGPTQKKDKNRRHHPYGGSSLVLLELVLEVDLLNSGLSLSQDWDWCVFVVEMHIIVLIAVGVVSVLGVSRTTRRWCAGRTQIIS